jgi:hypothetical protein
LQDFAHITSSPTLEKISKETLRSLISSDFVQVSATSFPGLYLLEKGDSPRDGGGDKKSRTRITYKNLKEEERQRSSKKRRASCVKSRSWRIAEGESHEIRVSNRKKNWKQDWQNTADWRAKTSCFPW